MLYTFYDTIPTNRFHDLSMKFSEISRGFFFGGGVKQGGKEKSPGYTGGLFYNL
jgi:hypothetical protein